MSKNVYFDVLDDIVDKYNYKYHKTITVRLKHKTKTICWIQYWFQQ